ncbi:hypothetical protein IMY05_013G0052800 [Salix suchowensis]|nr:hypothetical protein IMY05_013G0052800 [Salix suchowensis]
MRLICAVFPICVRQCYAFVNDLICVSIQFNTCIFFKILWFLVCNIVSKPMKIHQEATTSCYQFIVSFSSFSFTRHLFEPS